MKRVALHNLGCKVNAYELDVMRQMLQENGYQIVTFDEAADIYIVNTCTVTNIADRKSRQMLHRAKKCSPEAVVVAVGCYVQTGDTAQMDACIDLAIGNNRKKELPALLEAFLKEREAGSVGAQAFVGDLSRPVPYEAMMLTETSERTRAFIKIQDGCNAFCSYCIIPYARGRVRSRKAEDICREAAALARAGCREIVVTGIHISSYGIDFAKAEDGFVGDARQAAHERGYLLRLLEELHKIEGIQRIRLGSLEPRIITQTFADRLRMLSKVCPHFHLSLQSGCDATLKRMNRHYLAGEYYEKVNILRNAFDNPAITTDVIAGFPGETADEFAQTEAFLERVGFYEMHVFPYSRRQGTAAAVMPGQVADAEKSRRSHILLALAKRQSRAYRETFPGKDVTVLFEEPVTVNGVRYMTGYTGEYVKAALRTDRDLANRIVRGSVSGFLQDDMLLIETAPESLKFENK